MASLSTSYANDTHGGYGSNMSLMETYCNVKHKFIHIMGYADAFSYSCERNKDLILLFGMNYLGTVTPNDSYGYYAATDQEILPNEIGGDNKEDDFIRFKALYTDV